MKYYFNKFSNFSIIIKPSNHQIIKSSYLFLPFLICFFLFLPSLCFPSFDDQFIEANDIGENKIPHFGKSRVLMVPIIIETSKYPNMVKWEKFFRYDMSTGTNTFSNFWKVNSLGKYDVEVVMVDPIFYSDCPLPPTFKNCAIPRGDVNALSPGIKFLKNLLKRVKEERKINFKDFDINGIDGKADNWIDGILVMSNASFPGVAFPISIFDKIEFDGVKIGAIAIAELNGDEVIALHEFGHLLGFGDLYHEKKRRSGLHFSLMGEYTKKIPLLDAYSRMKIGWANVEETNTAIQNSISKEMIVPPVIDTGKIFKIGSDKEFFLIENRGPDTAGLYDMSLHKNGIAIYHIDETKLPRPNKYLFVQLLAHCLNCDEWHPLIMNVQADGLFEIQQGLSKRNSIDEKDLFHTGNTLVPDLENQHLFSNTNRYLSSNWYNGKPSGIHITDIDSDTALPNISIKLRIF